VVEDDDVIALMPIGSDGELLAACSLGVLLLLGWCRIENPTGLVAVVLSAAACGRTDTADDDDAIARRVLLSSLLIAAWCPLLPPMTFVLLWLSSDDEKVLVAVRIDELPMLRIAVGAYGFPA
jgi:hypothetical protein